MADEQTKTAGQAPRFRMSDPSGYCTAYFYYVNANDNPTTKVYEYFDISSPIGDVQTLTLSLLGNALNDGSSPPCYSNNVDDLVRHRKGFIIIAKDGEAFPHDDPIEFIVTASSDPHATGLGYPHRYSFEHNMTYSVVVSGRTVGITIYNDELQNCSGHGDLGRHEWEEFRIGPLPVGAEIMDLYGDSGGTNMGPPAPPPLLPFSTRAPMAAELMKDVVDA